MVDPVLRSALSRIERSYIEPGRFDADRMLGSALRAAAIETPREIDGHPGREGSLVERLAPSLERALEQGMSSSRNGLRAALLGGALAALDPHSRALCGGARRRHADRFAGSVCGIGVRLGRRAGRIRILECHPGAAAERAGLLPGDLLRTVDGQPVEGRLTSEVVGLLRGSAGTQVTVALEREPPGSVSVVRGAWTLPSTSGRLLEGEIGVLRVDRLSQNTPSAVDHELGSMRPAGDLAGLVLDLRGNRGGSMLAAAAIADRFVEHGTLLEALDRDGRPVQGLAHRVESSVRARPGWPIVVLVDERTSSSAELLAAALVWNDRALLVGRRTFGKNMVAKLYPFEEADLALKLAVAYLGSAGRRLPAEGLEPDLSVDDEKVAASLLRTHGAPSRSAWLRRLGALPLSPG